ncbi:high mobility group box domain-containing protein [Mucor mucedo]|uniref:high mobility group box domain-containing protein n=1 Tax=Mucor mucedo TaxID=29922 RepID=UPI00221FE23A|nr:high mobility group box domain-containing protein [Mucor mucedo]KAI7895404.1 high mobility group box domain-containing protein [Mucor mucedo]
MSEQNLLYNNLFKNNGYTFEFPIVSAAPPQRQVATKPIYTTTATTSPYYLPPITPANTNMTFSSLMHQQKHWNNEASQMKEPEEQAPTHIVSPEAIREALKEEKEEALGHCQKPFSQYTSFHALKQRRFSDHSPPSFSIPFSPVPNYNHDEEDEEEEEEEEEPESPFPIHHHHQQQADDSKKLLAGEKLKRPPNAYLLFNRDMRRKLLKASPKMTVAEISKEVGDWWKALPDDKRDYYVREASILKQEHLKKYPDFIYTRRSKAELAEAKKTSKLGRKSKPIVQIMTTEEDELIQPTIDLILCATTTTTTTATTSSKKRPRKAIAPGGQRDPRGRKKKRHKHPFAPKHPMSAYLYYLASVYPKVSLEFPGSTVGPISKSISKTWHAMTVEERLPWIQKADSDKARYAREMQVYMANNNQEQLQKEQLLLQQQQQLQQDMDAQQTLQLQLQQLLSEEEETDDDEHVVNMV